ncbi:unnamed protein product [Rhizophagus irregularis]|nr:unnamed protein product [Rhizophagus irregularis]
MILLTIISFAGYYYVIIGDLDIDAKDINHISNYCTENFGVNKCNNLKIINRNVYVCSLVFSFLQLFYIIFKVKFLCFLCEKPENDILRRINRFTSILKHINIIIITVFPAIVSGYLISTNSITTKIAFGICTLSFTRLVNHFNEKPEKVNTLISFYLNGNDYKDKEQIEKLTEDMDELTKKLIDKVKYLNKQQDKKLTINHFNENPEKVNTLISFYLNDNDYKDKEQIEKLTEDMDELTKKLNYKIDEIKYLNEQNKERKYIELN